MGNLAVSALCLGLLLTACAAPASADTTTNWEYTTLKLHCLALAAEEQLRCIPAGVDATRTPLSQFKSIDVTLNQMASQSWELLSTQMQTTNGGLTLQVFLFFKRPVSYSLKGG